MASLQAERDTRIEAMASAQKEAQRSIVKWREMAWDSMARQQAAVAQLKEVQEDCASLHRALSQLTEEARQREERQQSQIDDTRQQLRLAAEGRVSVGLRCIELEDMLQAKRALAENLHHVNSVLSSRVTQLQANQGESIYLSQDNLTPSLKAAMEAELKAELTAKLEAEFRDELESQLKAAQSEAEMRAVELTAKLEDQMWVDMKSKLEAELTAKLEAELTAKLEAEFRDELESQLKVAQSEAQLRIIELTAKLEDQVRVDTKSKLEAELTAKLEAEFEAKFRGELESQLKAAEAEAQLRANWKAELTAKLKAEFQAKLSWIQNAAVEAGLGAKWSTGVQAFELRQTVKEKETSVVEAHTQQVIIHYPVHILKHPFQFSAHFICAYSRRSWRPQSR